MSNIIDVTVNEGKYRVVMGQNYCLYAERYGEKWRDLVGDNLVYSLAYELQEAREEIERLRQYSEDQRLN